MSVAAGMGYRGDHGEYPAFRRDPSPEEVARGLARTLVLRSVYGRDLSPQRHVVIEPTNERLLIDRMVPVVEEWIAAGLIEVSAEGKSVFTLPPLMGL